MGQGGEGWGEMGWEEGGEGWREGAPIMTPNTYLAIKKPELKVNYYKETGEFGQ